MGWSITKQYGPGSCWLGRCGASPVTLEGLCETHEEDPRWQEFGSCQRCRVPECDRGRWTQNGLCVFHEDGWGMITLGPVVRERPPQESGRPDLETVETAIIQEWPVEWLRTYVASQED